MIDARNVCQRDCPNRSAECRLTCERYKEYRAAKEIEYAKRAKALDGIPDSQEKRKHANRNAREKLRGR